MPRSMSTLLQCILNQNPEIAATPTDPVLEYLYGARMNYTNTPEVKAMDKDVAYNTWMGFCWGGLDGYSKLIQISQICVLRQEEALYIINGLKNLCHTNQK